MDLGEWELLPRSNYRSIDDDDDEAMMIRNSRRNPNPNHKNHLDMDHFICPSQDPPPTKQTEHSRRSGVVPTQLLQVPMTWEPIFSTEDTDHQKMTKPTDQVSAVVPEKILKNPDPVPSPHQVSFKKMKGDEFVDMKIDPTTRVTSPLPRIVPEGEDGDLGSKKDDDWDEDPNKVNAPNLWKLSLTGIGAICSFGVAAAAATIFAVLFGNNNNNNTDKDTCRNKNQMLRFQIYSDDDKVNPLT